MGVLLFTNLGLDELDVFDTILISCLAQKRNIIVCVIYLIGLKYLTCSAIILVEIIDFYKMFKIYLDIFNPEDAALTAKLQKCYLQN